MTKEELEASLQPLFGRGRNSEVFTAGRVSPMTCTYSKCLMSLGALRLRQVAFIVE